ncbi:MAG TPA: GNAT family N-acetyltransferase [Bacteroidia bacterium]
MQTLNYRKATESDLTQLQSLGLLAYGQYRPIITEENWDKWEANFNNDHTFLDLLKIATCFVCEADNELVGMAFFVPNGHPFLYFPAEWSYIRYIGVHPAFAGNGIGKQLTQLCIDAAVANGERTLALHTSEFQNAARHIYEQLGFIKQKELEPVFGKTFYIYTMEF